MKKVRLLEELSPLEKLGLVKMSYSRIDSFAWCPAKFYYKYIYKEQEEGDMPHAWLGNIVHGVLEERLPSGRPLEQTDLDVFLEEFEVQREIYDPSGVIEDKLIDMGKQCLTDFVDKHSGKSFQVLAKEKEFNLVVGSALVNGKIDRVDIDHKKKLISLTDYKTGSREVAQKDISRNLQLGVYALALKKEYPDYQIYGELYYLRSERQKGHLFSDDDLDAIEVDFISVVKRILETGDFAPTSNKRACYWCWYAQSGTCPIGAKRVRG